MMYFFVPDLFVIMATRHLNVLKGAPHIRKFVQDLDLKTYTPYWPFTPKLQCFVISCNAYGETNPLEITLNHQQQQFERQIAYGSKIRARTPYNLLVQLSQAGLVKPTAPAGNWRELYFTLDKGNTYINGFQLTRANAEQFGKDFQIVQKQMLR